jgi:hypothetical protein
MAETAVKQYPESSDTLHFLHGSLEKMFVVVDRYVNRFLRDGYTEVPYKYNERATLSLLAGGIWLGGESNLVLEEVASEKRSKDGSYGGRDDIWFVAEGNVCYGEAKQEWPDASRFAEVSTAPYLEKLRGEAVAACLNAAARIEGGYLDFAFGVLFVVPHLQIKHVGEAQQIFAGYYASMDSALRAFCARAGGEILWGKYFRPDLLAADKFYKSGRGNLIALDALVSLGDNLV